MSADLAAWLLVPLAVLGLVNAIYFTLIYYRLVQPDSGRIPSVCRLGVKTCQSVVFTRYGRVTGLPIRSRSACVVEGRRPGRLGGSTQSVDGRRGSNAPFSVPASFEEASAAPFQMHWVPLTSPLGRRDLHHSGRISCAVSPETVR